MNEQSLADQLGWCNTTRVHLQELQNELAHGAAHFDGLLAGLRDAKYVSELLARLVPYQQEFTHRMTQTNRHIDESHISYINGRSAFVCDQLAAIQARPGLPSGG
jgi:hypothetical protein